MPRKEGMKGRLPRAGIAAAAARVHMRRDVGVDMNSVSTGQ